MLLRQQIIQDQIEKISSSLKISKDIAFLRFAHSLITGQSMHSFNLDDIVDGGQDKQIDVITIEQDEADEAKIYILQIKNTDTFSSNALVQMRNGLNWIFNKSKSDIEELSNKPFKDKVFEYRSIQSNIGPSNLSVIVGFVTNGISESISDECYQEIKTIKDEYDNGTFNNFEFLVLGADELVSRLNAIEKRDRTIDANIKIKYDTNNPSIIKYYASDLKGLVCTASAIEIANIINNDITGSIFDSNIRRFLGHRGAVNSEIKKTCTEKDTGYLFWFLNNGITIICNEFDAVTDPDDPHVKIKNMQIVNGCQTATTLSNAYKSGKLTSDVRILLRIYETQDPDLVNKIVLTTNNQNKISGRDLRANDPTQVDMERAFLMYNYYYERKLRQYDNQTDIDTNRIIPNELVAQSYLAVNLKKPSDARRRKYKVWGELYEDIFGGQIVERYILSTLICKHSELWLRKNGYNNSQDDIRRKLAKNGTFHVARITSFLFTGGDCLKSDLEETKKKIIEFDINPEAMDIYQKKALDILEGIIKQKEKYAVDLDTALKSYELDDDITKCLYKNK